MNDSWCLNIDKQPFFWSKLDCKGDIPSARVYHSADVCQSGAAAGNFIFLVKVKNFYRNDCNFRRAQRREKRPGCGFMGYVIFPLIFLRTRMSWFEKTS
jgi:hypothetical protein